MAVRQPGSGGSSSDGTSSSDPFAQISGAAPFAVPTQLPSTNYQPMQFGADPQASGALGHIADAAGFLSAQGNPLANLSKFRNISSIGQGTPAGYTSGADLMGNLYKLSHDDPAAFAQLQTNLRLAGYGKIFSTGFVDGPTLSGYAQLLFDTEAYEKMNGRPIYTPDTLLAAKIAANNKAGSPYGSSDGSTVSTSRNVRLTDATAAAAAAHDTFTSHLGRNPNKKERAAFTAALRAYEQSHPTLSTTRTDAMGNSSTTTTGGANSEAFAQQYTSSTQQMANEQGTMNELGFANVLQRMIGG